MKIKKHLGNRIREIRINKSLTQEMLAEKINMSAKSLSQIELGNNFVSAETLEAICVALDISPNKLFDIEMSQSEVDPLEEINNSLKNNPKLLNLIYKIIKARD